MNTYRKAQDEWAAAVEAAKPAYILERAELHLQVELTKQWADAYRKDADKPFATSLKGKAPRNAATKALGKAWAKAILAAEKETTRHFYFLAELDGVVNPWATDPDFGWASEEPQQAAPAPSNVRANKYGGKCTKCNGWVEAGEGALAKDANGKWAADHIGECPAKAPKADTAPAKSTPAGLDLSGMVPGYYAVPNGDTRLKVAISHGKNNWEGFTFVKDAAEYGAGSRYGMQKPGQPYQGKIQTELAAILADPKAAMAAYGKLVGKCGACGRTLEDETSIANGIGPICATKF